MAQKSSYIDHWTWVAPIAAWAALITALMTGWGGWFLVVVAALLGGAVFAAVHHAEVIAHRIGEPYGTLVLAVAVTVIEVALIISIMLAVGDAKAALARDTVFAAIMIVCNGIVGVCLLLGGLRHREQVFHLEGASAALAVLAALSVLALVLPNYATTVPGPMWSPAQLAFSGIASLVLYGAFVFIQTVRHREYFLAAGRRRRRACAPALRGQTWASVRIAARMPRRGGRPRQDAVAGHRSGGAGLRARPKPSWGSSSRRSCCCRKGSPRRARRMPTSCRRASTSRWARRSRASASPFPVIAAMFIVTGRPLVLGLGAMDTVLLMLTLLVSAITLGTGRTTILQGVVHLVIFAAFVFLSVVP